VLISNCECKDNAKFNTDKTIWQKSLPFFISTEFFQTIKPLNSSE